LKLILLSFNKNKISVLLYITIKWRINNMSSQIEVNGTPHNIVSYNDKQYLQGTETTIFGLKVVREYLGQDDDGDVKKGSVIILQGKFDEKIQNGLGSINKAARGYWLAIPAIATLVIGLFEVLAAVAVIGHALGTWIFCDLEDSNKHGDVKLQMKIGGILLKNGIINMVSGVFEMVPFIGAEVARYVGKKQGWNLEKAPQVLQPTTMSFLDMTVERTIVEETKNEEITLSRGPIEIRQATGDRYESIKKLLVSGTERKPDGKQAFSSAKGWWLGIPGALTVILGLGEMFIGLGKMLYPLGVLACCGITKVNSRNHSECALHAKLGMMLFKRGIGDLILGLRLMIPKHGARTARNLYNTNITSGLWSETKKTIIRSNSDSQTQFIAPDKEVEKIPQNDSFVPSGYTRVKHFNEMGQLTNVTVEPKATESSKSKKLRPKKIWQRFENVVKGNGFRTNNQLKWMNNNQVFFGKDIENFPASAPGEDKLIESRTSSINSDEEGYEKNDNRLTPQEQFDFDNMVIDGAN
jgi:hypothetical protein